MDIHSSTAQNMGSDRKLHALADALAANLHVSAATHRDELNHAYGRPEPRRTALQPSYQVGVCMCGCSHPVLRRRAERLSNVTGQPMAGHNCPTGEWRDSPTTRDPISRPSPDATLPSSLIAMNRGIPGTHSANQRKFMSLFVEEELDPPRNTPTIHDWSRTEHAATAVDDSGIHTRILGDRHFRIAFALLPTREQTLQRLKSSSRAHLGEWKLFDD